MKRLPFNDDLLKKLKVDRDDDPLYNFPLLRSIEFSMKSTFSLLSTLNEARGTSKEHGNVDALTASMKRGWDVGAWPFPFININGSCELIDRRHSKSAAESLLIKRVPAVEYVRVSSDEWDCLDDKSVLILAAIRFNVDGTTNATKEHFVHVVLTVCKIQGFDHTDIDIVRGLLDLAGVNERYNHVGPITSIENKILGYDEDEDGPISMTKHCTDEDFSKYVDTLPQFGDNQVDKDGTLLHVMVTDPRYNKRYAWDLLRHIWEAEALGKSVRVLIRSKSTTARGVRKDREDLFTKVVEYCNLAYDSYRLFAADVINSQLPSFFGGGIDLPRKGVENLPGEVYVVDQLDGEEAPQLVDFLDYYPHL
jgi:hypothetical protein